MKEINDCHKDFLSYRSYFDSYDDNTLSESDTRSKIIDKIFTEVLDWNEESIKREGHVNVGYYDYLFGIPGFKFVVEAKKKIVDIKLPTGHKSMTLGTFTKSNKELTDQIRKYLFEIGLNYAVITNGYQFIIGKFSNTNGDDWKHNKCLIFNGFDDIDERFVDFYNILSMNSITENSGFGLYLEEYIQRNGRTILSSIPAKDSELVRNPLSSELTPIINDLFGELYNIDDSVNRELIEECFIENKEIKKNRSEIEKLFSDSPPPIDKIVRAVNTENIVNQISTEITEDDFKIKSNPPNPIIIVGSKGAGKSTFINYLFYQTKDKHKSHPHIYIDFRKYSGIKDTFKNLIYTDILEQIYEKYNSIELTTFKALCSIYHKDIRRNNESIWKFDLENRNDAYQRRLDLFLEEKIKNSESHFFQLSQYLIINRRTRLCIVIDNADQFNSETQKEVFLFSQSLNKKGNVIIIISLREGYYYKWRYLPPFDAFPSNVYHITAPPYKKVLEKRISYALSKIELVGISKGNIGDNKTLVLKNDSVRKFLLSLESTLFGDENSKLLNFIQETTYPNIREGLQIFNHFLISGHTEVHEYILRQETNPYGTKIIPFWEFIKAVGLNNKKYYNHSISIINNLFYPSEGSRNHFLKIKILRLLDNKLVSEGASEKYYNVEELIYIFVNAGYIYKYIKKEIEELSKSRLIETDEQFSDVEWSTEISSDDSICISLKGHHYVNTLLNDFSYIEMTLEDTPIFNEDYFAQIKKDFPFSNDSGKRNLRGRVAVVEKFIEYLESEEKNETVESQLFAKNIVSSIKYGCSYDINRINRVLNNE